jgi:hypothetical protein
VLGRNYLLRWGVGTPAVCEVQFSDTDGLMSALDRVTCESIAAGATLRADLYTSPTVMDPLLIQFTVGDPSATTLLWHLDGEAMVAVDRGPEPAPSVSPSTLRDALAVYLLTGERASALNWESLPGD